MNSGQLSLPTIRQYFDATRDILAKRSKPALLSPLDTFYYRTSSSNDGIVSWNAPIVSLRLAVDINTDITPMPSSIDSSSVDACTTGNGQKSYDTLSSMLKHLLWLHSNINNDDNHDDIEHLINEGTSLLASLSSPQTHHQDTFTIYSSSTSFSLTIHSPDIVSADVGYKTWGGGILLTRFIASSIVPILTTTQSGSVCIELGSGTGLSGITYHKEGGHVVLTDFNEAVLECARRNVDENTCESGESGNGIRVLNLDWFKVHEFNVEEVGDVRHIIAADVIWGTQHAVVLPMVVEELLRLKKQNGGYKRFDIVLPLRPPILNEIEIFHDEMNKLIARTNGRLSRPIFDTWCWEKDVEFDSDEEPDNDDVMCRRGVWYRYFSYEWGENSELVTTVNR